MAERAPTGLGIAVGPITTSRNSLDMVRHLEQLAGVLGGAGIPQLDELRVREIKGLLEELGESAFDENPPTSEGGKPRPPLLAREYPPGEPPIVKLTPEGEQRFRERVVRDGFIEADELGHEQLVRVVNSSRGALEVRLSVGAASGGFSSRARAVAEVILAQVPKHRSTVVVIAAQAFRIALWPDQATSRSYPQNWKQVIDHILKALSEMRFTYKASGSRASKGFGRFIGEWHYTPRGIGGHGDGAYTVYVQPGFLGCLMLFQDGEIQTADGHLGVTFDFRRLTSKELKQLGGEDALVKIDAGAPLYDSAANLSAAQAQLVTFIHNSITRAKDPARRGAPHRKARANSVSASEPRQYDKQFCDRLPPGVRFNAALGRFKSNPEAGRTILGSQSLGRESGMGLAHELGYIVPEKPTRTTITKVVERVLDDVIKVVVDHLGGVVVGRKGRTWLSHEQLRELDAETLGHEVPLYLFVPPDWQERRRQLFKDVTGHRVTESVEQARWEALGFPLYNDGKIIEPLHRRLRATLQSRSVKYSEFGAAFGVGKSTISRWCNRQRTIPAAMASLLIHWIETGETPTDEELAKARQGRDRNDSRRDAVAAALTTSRAKLPLRSRLGG